MRNEPDQILHIMSYWWDGCLGHRYRVSSQYYLLYLLKTGRAIELLTHTNCWMWFIFFQNYSWWTSRKLISQIFLTSCVIIEKSSNNNKKICSDVSRTRDLKIHVNYSAYHCNVICLYSTNSALVQFVLPCLQSILNKIYEWWW